MKFCRLENKLRELEGQRDRHEIVAREGTESVKELKVRNAGRLFCINAIDLINKANMVIFCVEISEQLSIHYKMQTTQNEISNLENKIRDLKDEIATLHRERKSDLKTIEELNSEVEKKDQKVKARSQTITELMSQRELERNGFELALKGTFSIVCWQFYFSYRLVLKCIELNELKKKILIFFQTTDLMNE